MKGDKILNFILRGSVSLVGIYMLNMILAERGYEGFAAINIATFFLCAFFGFPGFLLILFVVFLRFSLGF